jgi:hypothetical protein
MHVDKNRKENLNAHFLKATLSPDDINGWFYDGNPVVVQYLTARSLNTFAVNSPLREMCISCMLNKWFDRLILLSICLNAVFLAADNPLNNDNQLVS